MANLERETEEALGLPPRAKETKPTVQEYMDDTGAMGLLTGPMSRGSGLLGGATAAYQFGRDLLGFNEQADDRALAGRKDDEGITPTKNYIYDLAIDKLGATPYQAQTVAMLAEATPIAGEYLGIEETANLIKEGRYKDAALSGAGTAAGIIPFIGDAAKAALRRGVDPEVVNQIIAGKGAKDFYGDDLRKAVELEEQGFSPEEIEEITGRFTVGSAEDDYFSEPLMVRGEPKPYFKFEIDDSDVLIKSNDGNITLKETSPSQPVNVGDIIDHPKLFAQYPEAKNVQFYFDASEDGGAYFDPSKGPRGSIVISGSRKDTDVSNMSLTDGRDFRKSFFHELQHAIQWQDKKIKGLEQIAGSPMGYMKTVAKPEKAYKGDLYLKKLGQNTKLINIKDEILELYKEGKKTNSWDFSSKLKIIDSDNKMLPEPVEIKEFYNNPESAKKIAKLMRALEQESFRTYMQTASEIEARAVGYRSLPHPYQSLPPIVPEIDKQKKIETLEEAYENTPNKPIQQAKNKAIYKLKPMTDEEISRYAQGAVNFAKYAEGVEPELKGFSDWGPTQKGFAQGGLTSMNDQTQMAFALGGEAETVDPVSGNDVPPGSLPEEVRDDIDAKLSEGEYVVPADVVRFFGVKFFEDLRTEAKMGLQQMDADGRIGGEPVQEQEDSMDVAELKAALSESGMYAGGLTDGGSLDTFIDDASRDPMVNGRMRASGATVKMAVGGLAVGNYGDVTKVDGIIQKLMTAANKDPALMEKLASKGIMVNKTGADKKSAEMKQANKPQEPIEAAEGTLVDSSPFDFGNYGTLGGGLFAAAGIKDPEKTITDTFLKDEGTIEQIVLIGPNGMEIPVAWNSATPIPEGFTKKATNEYGAAPTANATSGVPVAISTQDTLPRQTGDDSRVGPEPEPTTATPFDYENASIESLQSKLDNTGRFANVSGLAGMFLGPVGLVVSIGAKANHEIVKRRIEIELETRKKEGRIKAKDLEGEDNPLKELIDEVDTGLTDRQKKKLKKAAKPSSLNPAGMLTGAVRSFLSEDSLGFADSFLDTLALNAAEKVQRQGASTVDPNSGLLMTSGTIDPKAKTSLEKVTALKTAQDRADTRRFAKEEQERKDREAAQAAAQAAANARAAQAARRYQPSGGGGGDGGGSSNSSIATQIQAQNPSLSRGEALSAAAKTKSYSSNTGGYDEAPSVAAGHASGGKQKEDYGFGDAYNYKTGGLVSMPAAKKQKKRTTQRRKGLGTRP